MLKGNYSVMTALTLGCFLLCVGAGTSAGAEPLRVGYFKVAPHAMPDARGRPEGVAVMYFRRIAREMQVEEIDFVLLPLNRLLQVLAGNRIDMALLLAKDRERAAKFVYPDKPFCVTKPSIAVSTAFPLPKVKTLDDLLPLAFHETPANFRTPVMRDPRLRIEPLSGDDFTRRCFTMIVAGRIDACYQPDHYPLQFEAARETFRSKVKVLYLPDPPIGLYSVFSKAAAPRYRQRYESALAAVKRRCFYGSEYEIFMEGYREK